MIRAALLLLALALPVRAEEFALASWNLQTFGRLKPSRQAVCRSAYAGVISSAVFVLAAQEVANPRGLETFLALLPGGPAVWAASFQDTSDSQDNAVLVREARVTIDRQGFVFADAATGRPDRRRALHPIRWAHLRVDDLDFTLLSLHLTFQGGDTAAAKRELRDLLDWLAVYFSDPKNDPDVIVAGDFNLSLPEVASVIREHGRFADGPERLTVLVSERTSRARGRPVNSYDHFLVSRRMQERALVSAGRAPLEFMDRADRGRRAKVSDHYPVLVWLRSRGLGIAPDSKVARVSWEAGPDLLTGL